MDKNALTEQRRETVIGLLKGMDIKKSVEGGFDRDDVYDCMQRLCDLYEKSIETLENSYEEELVLLKDKYQKYDDNNDLYVSLIMEAKKSSNEIINQAKSEVESILNEGKVAVAKQEDELEKIKKNVEAEKAAMMQELEAMGKAVEAEKVAMRAELQAEKEKVSALKNKYNQQLNSMEEEFSEIKTNILRTAGQIDGLKSKLPQDQDEISWDVSDGMGSVEFPLPEVQVEDIIEEAPLGQAHESPSQSVPERNWQLDAEEFADMEASAYQEPVALEEDVTLEAPVVSTMPVFEETASPEPEAFTLEDLDLEDITVDIPDLDVAPEASNNDTEEISFDGLEELFKEDK